MVRWDTGSVGYGLNPYRARESATGGWGGDTARPALRRCISKRIAPKGSDTHTVHGPYTGAHAPAGNSRRALSGVKLLSPVVQLTPTAPTFSSVRPV